MDRWGVTLEVAAPEGSAWYVCTDVGWQNLLTRWPIEGVRIWFMDKQAADLWASKAELKRRHWKLWVMTADEIDRKEIEMQLG